MEVLELKSVISEMKNSVEVLNTVLSRKKTPFHYKLIEIIQSEEQKDKE